MQRDVSPLERARTGYRPRLPRALESTTATGLEPGDPTSAVRDAEAVRDRFPRTFGRPTLRVGPGATSGARALTVGVVLSGGQAPGGHNVIAGLFDAVAASGDGARLHGFLGGPKGVFTGDAVVLDAKTIERFRNTGGFDMIRSGRDKIETAEQLAACRETCTRLALDGLVVVGGDDSNTNAAVLAEHFAEHDMATAVVGVPKTIDGDLKAGPVEASFGFDTATRVYAALVGNICRDARSAAKYWHFIRLMGRSASHVTLEVALQTRANVTLIGEEIREQGATLDEITNRVAEAVRRRYAAGRSYGVCLVPEGLIEFIPEMGRLIAELNDILAGAGADDPATRLGAESRALFEGLPPAIREQLLLDRDSHGNVLVSQIDTELLLTGKVAQRLDEWKRAGKFDGSFKTQNHFFGYEGRCAAPTDFDADYTYGLGRFAAALIAGGHSGYMSALSGLAADSADWTPVGVPLTSLMQIETRKGKQVPVIAKALVRTDAEPFSTFAAARERWALEDEYLYPGAIQYFGPDEVRGARTRTLQLESGVRGGGS
ncbi:MAG: diphosphate--fructose-6-phosphate 1-phosphotransferase [bacterium]|nr:diphosphate--fructose-6-phosphate 1-phosphotransferase [bacterium]